MPIKPSQRSDWVTGLWRSKTITLEKTDMNKIIYYFLHQNTRILKHRVGAAAAVRPGQEATALLAGRGPHRVPPRVAVLLARRPARAQRPQLRGAAQGEGRHRRTNWRGEVFAHQCSV